MSKKIPLKLRIFTLSGGSLTFWATPQIPKKPDSSEPQPQKNSQSTIPTKNQTPTQTRKLQLRKGRKSEISNPAQMIWSTGI